MQVECQRLCKVEFIFCALVNLLIIFEQFDVMCAYILFVVRIKPLAHSFGYDVVYYIVDFLPFRHHLECVCFQGLLPKFVQEFPICVI